MKIFSLVLLIFSFLNSIAQPDTEVNNGAFRRGEKLVYRIYFKSFITGRVNAGEVTLQIKNTNRKFNGRDTYHIECLGKTSKSFNWFIKVEDRFESFIDEKSLLPWLFIRRTREGHYKKDDEVEFFHDKMLAKSRTAVKKTPSPIHDFLSAYYYIRTTNITKLDSGKMFSIPIFFDDSVFVSDVICHDRGTVKTKSGTYNCVLFRPKVITGNVFSDRFPMTIWISDDENKIPIFAKSTLILGRVEVELVGSKELANPFLSKVE